MPTMDQHPDSLRLRSLIDLHTAIARVIPHGVSDVTLQIFPLDGQALSLTLSHAQRIELAAAIAPKEMK